jgi:hypothetical protein
VPRRNGGVIALIRASRYVVYTFGNAYNICAVVHDGSAKSSNGDVVVN